MIISTDIYYDTVTTRSSTSGYVRRYVIFWLNIDEWNIDIFFLIFGEYMQARTYSYVPVHTRDIVPIKVS